MGGKRMGLLAALAVAVLAPAAPAGVYIGDWGYCWKPAPGCPCGEYSWLHYWAPGLYRVKYCCQNPSVDSYPPGLPIPARFQLYPFPYRSAMPRPTHPYGDPAGFYGRPLVPPPGQTPNELDKAEK